MMTKEELMNVLKDKMQNGSLMTPKHDPHNLGITHKKYRTVLSHELAENLSRFVFSENYSVVHYNNTHPNHFPDYYVITPDPSANFSVTASGVTSNSLVASSIVDKLVVVSGRTDGWHMFGEHSDIIQAKFVNGSLSNPINL